MAGYTNPGSAAVAALHDFMLQREALKDRELERKHRSEVEKRQLEREERQAKMEQEKFEFQKQEHEDAKKDKNYQRVEKRIDSMVPGDIPDPELLGDVQKYMPERLQKLTAPSSGIPGVAAVPMGQEQTGVLPQESTAIRPTAAQAEVIRKRKVVQDSLNSMDPASRAAAEYYDARGQAMPAAVAQGVFKLAPVKTGTTPQVGTFGDYLTRLSGGDPSKLTVEQIDAARKKWTADGRAPSTAAGSGPPDSGDVARAAAVVLGGKMSPSQAISAFGGMGVDSARFKRAMNLEIVRQNPDFNFQAAESDYQFGKNATNQSTVRFIDNLNDSVPILKELSAKVKRTTSFKIINRATLAAMAGSGNVDANNFAFGMTAIADEMAKTLQGGGTGSGTTDTKMKQALDLFDKGMTPEQLDGVLTTAQEFLGARRRSLTKGTYMEKKDKSGTSSSTGGTKKSAKELIDQYRTKK